MYMQIDKDEISTMLSRLVAEGDRFPVMGHRVVLV